MRNKTFFLDALGFLVLAFGDLLWGFSIGYKGARFKRAAMVFGK